MLIYEVLKIRDFSKLLRLLFATPQKLLRDPLSGRDPPVGNHCLTEYIFRLRISHHHQLQFKYAFNFSICFLWV